MRFIDRTEDLESLQELWGMRHQLALLYGRRRLGKTTLLQRFAEGKPTIFFGADEGTSTEQLARLTDRILAYRDDPVLRAAPLANWDQALAWLLGLTRDARDAGRPLLVVLDEFPRLVLSTPRLPSLLQDAIEDVKREDLPLFLVLAGSQINMFERHVLHGPLYGRRTWSEQLPPLGYREAGEFFPGWSAADRFRSWALLGGIPYYLEQWDPDRSLAWNIERRLLSKGAVLYDEAEMLVKEELGQDASTYQSIIAAVADGSTRQSEIASKVGIPATSAPAYLAQLARLHILERRLPMGAATASRAGIWHLVDPYLRAWFRFVRTNRTDLDARRASMVLRERVMPALDEFVSKPGFEEAVRADVSRRLGVDPAFPARARVGAWWGPVPDDRYAGSRRTRQGELGLVGHDGDRLVLAGEAKWQRRPVDLDALVQLDGTARHVPGFGSHTTRVLYSRVGFTTRLVTLAAQEGVLLRTVEDMYE